MDNSKGDSKSAPITYGYLISTFLKVGSLSFGGFMVLVSMVQKQMVEKDKKISDEIILNGISLASILPGPLAVNTVCYIGFKLKGFWGAMVSMIAVILPSFVLMIFMTYIYYEYGDVKNVNLVLSVIMPAIIAIILSVAINMHQKHILEIKQYIIAITSILLLQFIGGILASVIVILFGIITGILFYKEETIPINKLATTNASQEFQSSLAIKMVVVGLLFAVLIATSFAVDLSGDYFKLNAQLAGVFSSMSLTLFGGGYVVIPLIQETVVGELGWLSSEDFNTAIALSQVTPGPILISATFIGYKLAGLLGALVATIGIFLPSGFLMIILSHSLEKIKNSSKVVAAYKGLRPAIIGLIYSACITIGMKVINHWLLLILMFLLTLLIIRFKISSVLIILGTAVLGLLISLL